MKLSKDGIKDFLNKKKDEFNALIAPAAVPAVAAAPPIVAPVAPVVPVAPAPKTYTLQDGTQISVQQAGDAIAVGDTVMANGLPVAAGTWTLDDGTVITTDAAGVVAGVTAPAPVTVDATAPAPVAAVPVAAAAIAAPATPKELPTTPEAMRAMYAAFASGSTEDRLSNLETMLKACMEYCFGYQIQQANAVEAVSLYKEELSVMTAQMSKHVDLTKGMFELCEQLLDEPAEEPKTLNGNQKARFEKMTARDERHKKIAETLKKNKALA